MANRPDVTSLFNEAEKYTTSGCFRSPEWQLAAEKYTEAGNYAKLCGDIPNAEFGYQKAIECWQAIDDDNYGNYQVACLYIALSALFKLTDSEKMVTYLKMAIQTYEEMGKIDNVIQKTMELAEHYDVAGNINEALPYYNKVISLCEISPGNYQSRERACRQAIAKLQVLKRNYLEAAAIYTRLVNDCSVVSLGQHYVPRYAFKAIVCYLAGEDVVAARRQLQMTQGDFLNSTEGRFCYDLINIFDAGEVKQLQEIVRDFNARYPLDQELLQSLLAVQTLIEKREKPSLC